MDKAVYSSTFGWFDEAPFHQKKKKNSSEKLVFYTSQGRQATATSILTIEEKLSLIIWEHETLLCLHLAKVRLFLLGDNRCMAGFIYEELMKLLKP